MDLSGLNGKGEIIEDLFGAHLKRKIVYLK
jgi:hypothetical protein